MIAPPGGRDAAALGLATEGEGTSQSASHVNGTAVGGTLDRLIEFAAAGDQRVANEMAKIVLHRRALEKLDTVGAPEVDEPREPIALLTRTDLKSLPKPAPLIADTLDQGTSVVIAGYFGTLKTFIALDWALSVTLGQPWLGRYIAVQHRVLFVAAEGANGLDQRITAWERRHALDVPADRFMVYPGVVNLGDSGGMRQLAATITGEGFGFVVLDTLAKCMPGMDENSSRDMGIAVAALDRIKTATDGGLVVTPHHTTKDKSTVRGSSALENGVDTVYVAEGSAAGISLTRTKRKDGVTDDRLDLKFVGVDGTGSGVVQYSHSLAGSTRSADELYSHFRSHFGFTGATTTQMLKSSGMADSTFYRARQSLLTQRLLINVGTDKRPIYQLPQDKS